MKQGIDWALASPVVKGGTDEVPHDFGPHAADRVVCALLPFAEASVSQDGASACEGTVNEQVRVVSLPMSSDSQRGGILARKLNSTYFEIARKISSVERDILAFQSGIMRQVGTIAAADSNLSIILSDRLSKVWRRLGVQTLLRSR